MADIQDILLEVAEQIKEFIANAATMQVETWYVEIGAADTIPADDEGQRDFRQVAKPLAQTIVKFDGDCIGVVPMRKGEDGYEVDEDLLKLHEGNVTTASDYRAGILNAAVDILKERL